MTSWRTRLAEAVGAGQLLRDRRLRRERRDWERAGRPVPPPQRVKHELLLEVAGRCPAQVFIETGTYLGDTVHALRRRFREIHSIELDLTLCEAARRRFAGVRSVTIHQGDSATVLPELLSRLAEPALFWLDGHFSGGVTARGQRDTPIQDELRCILRHPVEGHVVLIDDARLFGTDGGYPTLDEVREMVAGERPSWTVTVDGDVIRQFYGPTSAIRSARLGARAGSSPPLTRPKGPLVPPLAHNWIGLPQTHMNRRACRRRGVVRQPPAAVGGSRLPSGT